MLTLLLANSAEVCNTRAAKHLILYFTLLTLRVVETAAYAVSTRGRLSAARVHQNRKPGENL